VGRKRVEYGEETGLTFEDDFSVTFGSILGSTRSQMPLKFPDRQDCVDQVHVYAICGDSIDKFLNLVVRTFSGHPGSQRCWS
jgi:hypothetical protein